MTTTARLYLEIAGAVLAVVLGGLWLHEHDKRIQQQSVAEARQQALDEANKQAQQKIDALETKRQQDKAASDAKIDALVKTVASLKTPQQQVQWSQEQLKDVIKGILFEINPKTGEVTATIPASSVPELPTVIEKCKTCELNLDTTTKQLSYSQQQQQLMAGQLVNMTKERDDYKVAAKGGSALHRTWDAVKLIVPTFAIGYLAGHKF